MPGVTCNRCGSEIDARLPRCQRCGAAAPVVWPGGLSSGSGSGSDEPTRVSDPTARPLAERGDLVLERYRVAGEPRADLWGAYMVAHDTEDDRDVTLYRIERSLFRQRSEIDRFRAAQQALSVATERVLVVPERAEEWARHWYLVYPGRLSATLRDPGSAALYRGAAPDNVGRMLGFVSSYVEAIARGGIRLPHLCLRPTAVLVVGRELRVVQTGFAASFAPETVARRAGHDTEARFYAAPEVIGGGRGSARSDLFSLARLIGFSASGRERTPLFKGFAVHPNLKRALAAMAADDESRRASDLGALAADLRALVSLPDLIVPAERGVSRKRAEAGTERIGSDDIEVADDEEEGGEGTARIEAGDVQPVEESERIDADEIEPVEGSDRIAMEDVEPVEESDGETLLTDEVRPFDGDETLVEAVSTDLLSRAASGGPVGAVEESDGSIDPRLLRAAVRSDVEKGKGPALRAIELLEREASKGDARARALLLESVPPPAPSVAPPRPSTAPPPRPSTAPPPRPSTAPPPPRPPTVPPVQAAPAPAPAPRRRPIVSPASVGPALVVKKPKEPVVAVVSPPAATEDELPTQELGAAPKAVQDLVIRRVPRPAVEADLQQTEPWRPEMEPLGPGSAMRSSGGGPPQTLFDDSYRLFKASDLRHPVGGQGVPDDPEARRRSMDLIWWSLAAAGALILVALLVTFR